jgi:nitrogen fixation NifU-like protein
MNDLYREIILDHYKNPRNFGKLSPFDAMAEKDNPLCGDEITMYIAFTKANGSMVQRVSAIKFSGVGCAISMASASLLTEKIKGMKIKDLFALSKDDIVDLLGTELTPARIKCALLPLEVIHTAIIHYEEKK